MSAAIKLREFAEQLKPSDEKIDQAKSIQDEIRNIISQNIAQPYRVDRCIPGGSFSKKTAIKQKFDVDLVFIMNVALDEFVLQRPHICLKMVTILLSKGFTASCNEYSVQCHKLGFDFDLLPATNAGRTPQEQYNNIVGMINSQPKPERAKLFYEFSSSLVEKSVHFMAQRGSYTHCLARLAKYWMFRNILYTVTFSGKSSAIELIAVIASEQVQSQDMLVGYRRFLELVANLEQMEHYWKENYNADAIPLSLKRKPYLIDPCNPLNNRLYKMSKDASLLDAFKTAALHSLSELNAGRVDLFHQPDESWCVIS